MQKNINVKNVRVCKESKYIYIKLYRKVNKKTT